MTIWELGEAAGPLLIAPLSELYGRYPVVNIANVLFTAFTVLSAISPTASVLIFARALTGVAVASNVLSPAIVGDIFVSEKRGTAMSLISLAPLIGGAAGPAIAGAIAQTVGWRKVLWMSAALAGACEVAFLLCFRETYKVEILKRKAARLRKETGNLALRSEFDAEEGGHSWQLIGESVLRPLIVLKSSFALQILALFGSFTFTYFYIMSTSLPPILQQFYDFTPAATGFAFLAFSKLPPTLSRSTGLKMQSANLVILRRRIDGDCYFVQHVSRQGLRQTARHASGSWAAGVPLAIHHSRKHPFPYPRLDVRLGDSVAPARGCLALRGRAAGHFLDAIVPSAHGIRGRCVWHLLGLCCQCCHCDTLSHGDIRASCYGASCVGVWVRLGLHRIRGDKCRFHSNSHFDIQIWIQMATNVQVHEGLTSMVEWSQYRGL